MKRILLFSSIAAAVVLVLIGLSPQPLSSTSAQAPSSPGATGSGTDARTCATAGCHSGTPTPTAGMIMHDIPSTGWEAGEVYNFTVQGTSSTANEFGFQITAENGTGGKQGIFNTTGGTTVTIQAGGQFASHNGPRTATGGGASWSFNWTAPPVPAITGDITFFTAVNAADNDNTAGGDMILTDKIVVMEDTGTTSSIKNVTPFVFQVGPNPTVDFVNVSADLFSGETIELHVFDISGQIVETRTLGKDSFLKTSISTNDWAQGTYFVRLSQGSYSQTQKFVKL